MPFSVDSGRRGVRRAVYRLPSLLPALLYRSCLGTGPSTVAFLCMMCATLASECVECLYLNGVVGSVAGFLNTDLDKYPFYVIDQISTAIS